MRNKRKKNLLGRENSIYGRLETVKNLVKRADMAREKVEMRSESWEKISSCRAFR